MLLAVLVAMAATGGASASGGDLAYTDLVTISSTPLGNSVPGAFVGISLEYGTVLSAELAGRDGADPVLAQLIRNLSPGYAPVIRIGGDSGDGRFPAFPGRGGSTMPSRRSGSRTPGRSRGQHAGV